MNAQADTKDLSMDAGSVGSGTGNERVDSTARTLPDLSTAIAQDVAALHPKEDERYAAIDQAIYNNSGKLQ